MELGFIDKAAEKIGGWGVRERERERLRETKR